MVEEIKYLYKLDKRVDQPSGDSGNLEEEEDDDEGDDEKEDEDDWEEEPEGSGDN